MNKYLGERDAEFEGKLLKKENQRITGADKDLTKGKGASEI